MEFEEFIEFEGQPEHEGRMASAFKRKRRVTDEAKIVLSYFNYDEINDCCICKFCEGVVPKRHKGNLITHIKNHHPIQAFECQQKINEIKQCKIDGSDPSNIIENFHVEAKSEEVEETKFSVVAPEKIIVKRKIVPHRNSSVIKNVLNSGASSSSQKIAFEYSPEYLINSCVEIVTINGRPLSLLDDSGFRKLIDPILASFKDPLQLDSYTIRNYILKQRNQLKADVIDELNDRIVTVKINCLTEFGRSFIGISVQFVKNHKLIVRSLGLKELIGIDDLFSVIRDTLREFMIDSQQIYRINFDNGLNWVKGGRNVKDTTKNDNTDPLAVDENYQEAEEFQGYSKTKKDFDKMFQQSNYFEEEAGFVEATNCHPHSLQFREDPWKTNPSINDLLMIVQEAILKIRNSTICGILKQQEFNVPILAPEGNFVATYQMLECFLSLKDFCNKFKTEYHELNISLENWGKIEQLLAALKILHDAIMEFQKDSLVLSEIFATWVRISLKLEKLANSNVFGKFFLDLVKKQSTIVQEDSGILASVYLDPRYQLLLSETQKVEAKNHILLVHEKLSKRSSVDQVFVDQMATSPGSDDELESILREKELKRSGKNLSAQNESVKNTLNCFDGIPREKVSEGFNILEYWAKTVPDFQELKEVSHVLFAAAGTQLSVEREKSALKFYLRDKENRDLDTPMLEAILFILLNQKYSK